MAGSNPPNNARLLPDLVPVWLPTQGTGKKEKITITAEKGRLSQEEIERMVQVRHPPWTRSYRCCRRAAREDADPVRMLHTTSVLVVVSAGGRRVRGAGQGDQGPHRRTQPTRDVLLQHEEQHGEWNADSQHPLLMRDVCIVNATRRSRVQEDGDKLKGKISEAEKKTVLDAVSEALGWLEENSEAESDEFREKLKDLEDVVNPIVAKAYQGAPGGPGGEGDDIGDHDEL